MPTGYTAKIEQGQTFQDFALGCARAFGALIHMRDDPADAEIPDEIAPSTYHTEQLDKAEARLDRAMGMTPAEIEAGAAAEYARRVDDAERYNRACAKLRRKYEAMLDKAKAWLPPTPEHEKLKAFMVEQIESSIEWDCTLMPEPVRAPPGDWHAETISRARRNIDNHRQRYAEDCQRAANKAAWIRALRESLEITDAR